MTDTSIVELRVRRDRAHESADLPEPAPVEEVDALRKRFEQALRVEAEKLAAQTEGTAEPARKSTEPLRVFLSFKYVDLAVLQLEPRSETQLVLYEQVLSDVVHRFESLCRFAWIDSWHGRQKENTQPLMDAWAELVANVGSESSRVIVELMSIHTHLRTSLDAESWSRGVQAIGGHKWHHATFRTRYRQGLYASTIGESASTDDVRNELTTDVAPWARALAVAAEKGDENAFEEGRSGVDWSVRSATDFALGIRLALKAGAHLAAREIALEGSKRFPPDLELRKFADVLAPPRIAAQATRLPNPAMMANTAWLREHGSDYRGLWVALRAGEVVASARTAESLREQLGKLTRNGKEGDDVC